MWLSDAQSRYPGDLTRLPVQLTVFHASEIGVALTTFGTLFMFLGVMLFFDAALLALGNMLFLSGLTLIIGPQKTFHFFARKQKLRGTICFLGGVLLVFFKYPFIGMMVETFGFLNLFGDFFPVVLTFLRQLPFVGTFLSLPYIQPIVDRLAGSRTSAV
ncbi:Got1-domain-containing protein [Lanmaoa asiatica]|nr:Got1-domain-containing protein [Lanmaoa asiatica]